MSLSSARLIRILVVFLSTIQLSSAVKAPSPLKLSFRPDESDNSTSTRDFLIPLDSLIDLDDSESYYFNKAFGGILRFDSPQNFWNAEITGQPSGAFKTICYVNYDSDGEYSRYGDKELMEDYRLLRLFTKPPGIRQSRTGEGTDDTSDGAENNGIFAVFCAAYYIRLTKLFEIYKSRIMGDKVAW